MGLVYYTIALEDNSMSKGTRIYQVRISDLDMALIKDTINRRNAHSPRREWNLSDFVRLACREKIEKMARSRRSRPRELAGEYVEFDVSGNVSLVVPAENPGECGGVYTEDDIALRDAIETLENETHRGYPPLPEDLQL